MVTIVADMFSRDQFIPVSISEPFSFRVHHNLRTSLNFWGLHLCLKLHIFVYYRNPLIHILVNWIASYPDHLGRLGKFVKNSTKPTCLEITGYQIKYCTVLWLLELHIRLQGLDTGTYCKQKKLKFKLPLYPVFKEESNYPDFLYIRMACHPN
jgi:hypothetical protein